VHEAVLRVARTLADLGHHLEEGTYPDGDSEDFLVLWKAVTASVTVSDWTLCEPINQWLAEEGRRLTPEQIRGARRRMTEPVMAAFSGVDLWLTPTIAAEPLRIGDLQGLSPRAMFDRSTPIGAFTAPFNVTGQPAATIPIAIASAGFPIGAQIVGQPFADALVLQLSRELEEALPWSRLHPHGYGW
jgi:amidase